MYPHRSIKRAQIAFINASHHVQNVILIDYKHIAPIFFLTFGRFGQFSYFALLSSSWCFQTFISQLVYFNFSTSLLVFILTVSLSPLDFNKKMMLHQLQGVVYCLYCKIRYFCGNYKTCFEMHFRDITHIQSASHLLQNIFCVANINNNFWDKAIMCDIVTPPQYQIIYCFLIICWGSCGINRTK